MLMSVVKAADKDFRHRNHHECRQDRDKGAFGDGKIFVSDVEDVYTISSGVKETGPEGGNGMKEVIAIVRMNMMNKTKKALTEAGVDAFFAHEAQGRGKGFVNPQVLTGAKAGLRRGGRPPWSKRGLSTQNEW